MTGRLRDEGHTILLLAMLTGPGLVVPPPPTAAALVPGMILGLILPSPGSGGRVVVDWRLACDDADDDDVNADADEDDGDTSGDVEDNVVYGDNEGADYDDGD